MRCNCAEHASRLHSLLATVHRLVIVGHVEIFVDVDCDTTLSDRFILALDFMHCLAVRCIVFVNIQITVGSDVVLICGSVSAVRSTKNVARS
jgi:hypothetical protein